MPYPYSRLARPKRISVKHDSSIHVPRMDNVRIGNRDGHLKRFEMRTLE